MPQSSNRASTDSSSPPALSWLATRGNYSLRCALSDSTDPLPVESRLGRYCPTSNTPSVEATGRADFFRPQLAEARVAFLPASSTS